LRPARSAAGLINHPCPSRSRRRSGLAWLAAAALCAAPALAADRPPTPERAAALKALIAKYFPAAQAGPSPLVTVAVEGAGYLISADLGVLNKLLEEAGASYEPATIVSRAVEQDDGNWRLTMDSLPPIAFRSVEANGALELTNFRSNALISPAIAWLLNGSGSADKGTLHIQTPKVDETIEFGALQETLTTVAGDGLSVSTQVKGDIAGVGFKVTGVRDSNAPINVSGQSEKALIDVSLSGFKSRKALELWGLLASHLERADLAAHEGELKGLLGELFAPGLKFAEGFEAQKTFIAAPIGAVTLVDAKYELGVANAGPESALSLNVAAEGLSLPVGLLPPGAGDLTPSKVDVTATLKGVDVAAAMNEWISHLNLQGDGPVILEQDMDKVESALLSAGPIRIEFAPSHVVGPAIDADFVGVVRLDHGKPAGELTVRMRAFDKTMAAVKALGPEDAASAMPALALAKGLAKSESDGSLSWLLELKSDRSMMVNGIPFGKAPD
jgi:hypothetical protein